MFGNYRWLLRIGGTIVIIAAFFGNLPGIWPYITGFAGFALYLAAGST